MFVFKKNFFKQIKSTFRTLVGVEQGDLLSSVMTKGNFVDLTAGTERLLGKMGLRLTDWCGTLAAVTSEPPS